MSALSVLIADDDERICRLLQRWLEAEGHHVESACTAALATQLCEICRFDVVVADMVLPGGGGTGLIRALKKMRRSFRIIAISGGGPRLKGLTCLQSAHALGAHGLLLKPFTEQQFFAAFRQVIAVDPGAGRSPHAPHGAGAAEMSREVA